MVCVDKRIFETRYPRSGITVVERITTQQKSQLTSTLRHFSRSASARSCEQSLKYKNPPLTVRHLYKANTFSPHSPALRFHLRLSKFLSFSLLSCWNVLHVFYMCFFVFCGTRHLIWMYILMKYECLPPQTSCKAAVAFFQFSILANYFWLLVEGMYLQTLLALTFVSQKKYFWWYILIGWGKWGK